jgi:ribosomal protein S18 acetylase RimI-like enzyme
VQFIDRELARRLEASEAIPQIHFAAELKRRSTDLSPAYEQIAGSHCVFIHPGCVVGRCVGLGLTEPVTAADLDRIEEFYRSRGEAAQIDVCPQADMSLLELMKERPYRLEELNDVLARPISASDKFDGKPASAEIRRIRPEEAGDLCEVVARAFLEGKDPEPQFVEIFRPLYLAETSFAFAAFVDGKLVGGAAGMVVPEAGIVTMFGSATLPEYRGRGIQSAFLRERMKIAQAAGAEYAVIVTRAGTTSQRNAQRAGFTLAYSKPVMKRTFTT